MRKGVLRYKPENPDRTRSVQTLIHLPIRHVFMYVPPLGILDLVFVGNESNSEKILANSLKYLRVRLQELVITYNKNYVQIWYIE